MTSHTKSQSKPQKPTGNLGQKEAKSEECHEALLDQLGGGSKESSQSPLPPKLGQKKAEQQAAADEALDGLSRDNARK